MERATSYINLLAPNDREQEESLAYYLIQEVESGLENPLDLTIKLRALEKVIFKVKAAIRDEAVKEARRHGKGPFEYQSRRVWIGETAHSYDYDHCGDPEYADLLGQLEERKAFLRAIKRPLKMATEDGEQIIINPPLKKSTTTILFK